MAITKTKFINYIRCPRYASLDNLKKEKLDSIVSYDEYQKEEEEEKIREILGTMYDENDNDLIDVKNEHLEIMLPFYNKAEMLAGRLASKYFKGNFKFSKDTSRQESFDAKINGIRYLCYVDIYNECDENVNIIEAKATTSKKFLSLGATVKDDFGDKKINSIFIKGDDHIYHLLEDLNLNIEDYMKEKVYLNNKQKLYDKYHAAGHYVYDLAVQRYIIENDLKQNNLSHMIDNYKYYLAVLNADYVFDGTYNGNVPVYDTDLNGNDIISYFDMTSITKDMLDIVDIDRKKVEKYINELSINKCPIGPYCENKKTTKCKYSSICWDFIPKKNSILNYLDSHFGFTDENGTKYERYELINSGMVHMLDVPVNYLNRNKNIIQREVVQSQQPYINYQKIKDGMANITYPIYHLDFETFPCPLPRFKGEKCYTQSVFQFSLHIETEEGICDKEKDHYGYLAENHNDIREDLIKEMCKWIDIDSGGTILVYNESFEKTRLKELAEIFPLYKDKLLKMRSMMFDLMNLTKTNTKLYKELGYTDEEASMFNYYHSDMSGSFSIKKILPLFSDLTYNGMEIGNGVEALIAYANFPKLNKKDFEHKYGKLVDYCKQDTWAMVEILKGMRDLVNK